MAVDLEAPPAAITVITPEYIADSLAEQMFTAASGGDWARVASLIGRFIAANGDLARIPETLLWATEEALIAEFTIIMNAFRCFADGGVDAPNNIGGRTALHIAAREGNVEKVGLLVDAGANVNGVDSDGYTPLHLAVVAKSAATVTALLDAGANRNAIDRDGDTPLKFARILGADDIVALLSNIDAPEY